MCSLTGQSCPLDRDPGKSFLPGGQEVVAQFLGYIFYTLPSVSNPCAKVLLPPTVPSWSSEAGG